MLIYFDNSNILAKYDRQSPMPAKSKKSSTSES